MSDQENPVVEQNPVVEEKPAEEKPAEEKPAEEAPAEEKPAEEAPADEKPGEEAPAEEPAAASMDCVVVEVKQGGVNLNVLVNLSSPSLAFSMEQLGDLCECMKVLRSASA